MKKNNFFSQTKESSDNTKNIYCSKQNLEIKKQQLGEELEIKNTNCISCSQLQNTINDLDTLFYQSQKSTPRIQSFFETSKTWFESFRAVGKNIIELYEKQIGLVSVLLEDVQNILLKEESEIMDILKNQEKPNNEQLEKLKDIVKKETLYPQHNIQEKIFNGLQTYSNHKIKLDNELEQKFDYLNKRVKQFTTHIQAELDSCQSTQKIEDVDLLEYSQLIEIVVTTKKNIVNVRKLISKQFKMYQIIETDHQIITALVLEQNQNKMYLSGSEQFLSIWQWRSESLVYKLEKKFITNSVIFKIIPDTMFLKMIAFSQKQIVVWDLIKYVPDQDLINTSVETLNQDIISADISNSYEQIICVISDYLMLWEKRINWKALDKLKQEKQKFVSIQFINNYQFAALSTEGTINVYEIQDDKILTVIKASYWSGLINGQLRYCKNQKKILCFNEIFYCGLEINNKTIQICFKKPGSNLRLCPSSSGDYLVIVNAGNLSFCSIKSLTY